VWPDRTLTVSAQRLRAACRCADCRRARIDRGADPNAAGVAIANVTLANVDLVGDHALNIAFSDGHDRGIYPWSYLHELAQDGEAGAGGRS
jgi:DUF971 family protein